MAGAIDRHRRAVHRQGRADLRRAADLDAAGGFGRVDQVVAAFDGGDRNRWRHGIEREGQRRRTDVAECIGLARDDGVRALGQARRRERPGAEDIGRCRCADRNAVDRKMNDRVGSPVPFSAAFEVM